MAQSNRSFANTHLVFKAGDCILEQDEFAKGLYILMSGEVEIVCDGVRLATISDKGAFLGEIGALLGGRRTASVFAKSETELLYIKNVTEYFESNPATAITIARTLAYRIALVDKKMADFEHFIDKWLNSMEDILKRQDFETVKQEISSMQKIIVKQLYNG